MANDLEKLGKKFRKVAQSFDEKNTALMKEVVKAVNLSLVKATPIDTGLAKSNWITTINSPANYSVFPYATGVKGSTASANITGVVNQNQQVLNGYKSENNSVIYLTNNVKYIVELNDGTSKQAPSAFIQKSIILTTSKFPQVRYFSE